MSLFVTGDTHGGDGYGISDMSKLNTRNFPEQKRLTKDDYVLITGDFGVIFYGDKRDKYWIKWLESKNFTTLFIDGNHENFDLLSSYPTETRFGGIVRRISDSIFQLLRGQSYTISGQRIFCLGGAMSHDRRILKNGSQSWWDAELPTGCEIYDAFNTIDKCGYNFDYIFTHEAPISLLPYLGVTTVQPYYLHYILEDIKNMTNYKGWYFGHYHLDKDFDKDHCVYQNVIKLA